MKHYVLGFVFNYTRTKVLLVKKERPRWQKGCWNGIGGKIENGESPLQAMQRESKEETGMRLNWDHCITFVYSGGTVFVYKAIDNLNCGHENFCDEIHFKQTENEKLEAWRLDSLPDKMIENLKWIIPILLSTCQFPIILHEDNVNTITEKSGD